MDRKRRERARITVEGQTQDGPHLRLVGEDSARPALGDDLEAQGNVRRRFRPEERAFFDVRVRRNE